MDIERLKTMREHLVINVGMQPDKIDGFIQESAQHLKKIMFVLDDAIDDGEFDVIVLNANKLKGALCDLGLDELSMVAKNIETTAASNAPAHLSCYYMRLQRELKMFLNNN